MRALIGVFDKLPLRCIFTGCMDLLVLANFYMAPIIYAFFEGGVPLCSDTVISSNG